MKKKLLVALAAISLSIIAALGLLAFKVNDIVAVLRPQIEQQLTSALGSKVELGEISASILPSLRLSIKEVKVTDSNSKSPAISLGGISAAVALGPLLEKKLKITTFQISNPNITLIKDASGMRVEGLPQQRAQTSPPPQPPSGSGAEPQALDMDISRIQISDGTITIDDRLSSRRTQIGSINLDAGVVTDGKQIQVPTLSLSCIAPGDLPLNFSGRGISYALDSKKLSSEALTIKGFGGELLFPTSLQLTPPTRFSTQPSLTNISIGELLKVAKPELSQIISGTITTAKGSFSGPSSGDVARSTTGSGTLSIRDAVIAGVNLPSLVLSKISNIPLLEGSLRSHIAPEHQRYFNDPNTPLESIDLNFGISQGTITINKLHVASTAFTLESSGTMTVDGELNLSSTFTLAADISRSLASRSKTIRSMLDAKEQLAIPVIIKGQAPALVIAPDISKLLAGAAGNVLEEKAGDLLEKALGGKKNGKGAKNPFGGLF